VIDRPDYARCASAAAESLDRSALQWASDDSEPEPSEFFMRLFTTAGAGTHNMVDHFDIM